MRSGSQKGDSVRGAPSPPPLFNIFHQSVMRLATKSRKWKADKLNLEVGIGMKWVPGSSFPSQSEWEKPNPEAKRVKIENCQKLR